MAKLWARRSACRRPVLELVRTLQVGDHLLEVLLVAAEIVGPERVQGGLVLLEPVVQ
jgi:hypothetical protein